MARHVGQKKAREIWFLCQQYSADEEVKRIIDIALGLEGLRRQDGIHAAAIVISPDKITNFLPIQRKGEKCRNSYTV